MQTYPLILILISTLYLLLQLDIYLFLSFGIGLLVLLWLKDHSTLRLLMSFISLSDNVNILHFLKLSEFYLIRLELLTYLLLDIQSLMFLPLNTVVQFFSHSGLHPIVGYKKVQYDNWINNIRNVKRFKNINLPEHKGYKVAF